MCGVTIRKVDDETLEIDSLVLGIFKALRFSVAPEG